MSRDDDETLGVLRDIWRAQGQDGAELDAAAPAKTCKRMAGVGFGAPGDDADLRAAWRETLRREGKLSAGEQTVRALVLRPGEPG